MLLPPIRQTGILLKRYRRFLADIALADGSEVTVHCPNSGTMRACSAPGNPVVISKADNPKRKYAWTLEMVQENGVWIGVNTGMTNKLVHEALDRGIVDDFGKITSVRPEVRVSAQSRLDFLIQSEKGPVYLEVKNCSLVEDNMAMFPDAVTVRGTKHLHELARLVGSGTGAAVLFCVQRGDGRCFAPARQIDPVYADTLAEAERQGVQVLAWPTGPLSVQKKYSLFRKWKSAKNSYEQHTKKSGYSSQRRAGLQHGSGHCPIQRLSMLLPQFPLRPETGY